MNYLFEPRSKIDYYDDDDPGESSSWDWGCILWALLLLPAMFLVGIAPFLYLAGYFFHDVYDTLKRTASNGKLCYPFLTQVGAVGVLVLVSLYYARSPGTAIKSSAALITAVGYIIIFTVLPTLAVVVYWARKLHTFTRGKLGSVILYGLWLAFIGVLLAAVAIYIKPWQPAAPVFPSPTQTLIAEDTLQPSLAPAAPTSILPERTVNILVDDFSPQPYQGDTVYFYNRIEGDRGALNDSSVSWNAGTVTAKITTVNTWGGIWMSLNHPIREGKSINFSAILPPQILPPYQSRITRMNISIADGTSGAIFRAELKDSGNRLQWVHEMRLNGEPQTVSVDLPPLQEVNHLVLVLDRAAAGDYLVVDEISFNAATTVTDTPTAAFVWSYGMLLNNWEASTGLVRDKAKDASGEFDAIQATGSLAAATALAEQLGVISRADALSIVDKIGDTLLNALPRLHGLWPHWVRLSPDGRFEIVLGTEWSSVDTIIAAIGLLDAQHALGLETAATERMLQEIEWSSLVTENGISHGYSGDGVLIPYAWDVFGGESWLVELAYASATGDVAPLAYPWPPTANGSGFIDELAWLYIKPPSGYDYWGTDWAAYRTAMADKQIAYYHGVSGAPCFARLGLFGLSAAEAPDPAQVPKESIYQAFGVGGQFAPANDGKPALGSPAVAPHYAAMIASVRPGAAIQMWDELIDRGYLSPLTNVESLAFPVVADCTLAHTQWNQLKGSWNLALQALGWGRYLAEREGKAPAVWGATQENPFLRNGYFLLAPDESPNAPKKNEDLGAILDKLKISCESENDYRWSLPGLYRYRITDESGNIKVQSVMISERQKMEDVLGWLPRDSSVPPGIMMPVVESGMESLRSPLGTLQSLRIDSWQEYRMQTMNHSDPSGTITISEWYACGVGLARAAWKHSWKYSYQMSLTERRSELELFSYRPLP